MISKQATAVYGGKEATIFPNFADPSQVKANADAFRELGAVNFREATCPNHVGWAKSAGKDINLVDATSVSTEKVQVGRSAKSKAIGKAIVVLAVLIETALFITELVTIDPNVDSAVASTINYAAQVALTVGGYFACEAVGAAMIGFSTAAIGAATVGVGLLFAAVGIGIGFLVSYLTPVYRLGCWYSELFVEDSLIVDTSGFQVVSPFQGSSHLTDARHHTERKCGVVKCSGVVFHPDNNVLDMDDDHPLRSSESHFSTDRNPLASTAAHPLQSPESMFSSDTSPFVSSLSNPLFRL